MPEVLHADYLWLQDSVGTPIHTKETTTATTTTTTTTTTTRTRTVTTCLTSRPCSTRGLACRLSLAPAPCRCPNPHDRDNNYYNDNNNNNDDNNNDKNTDDASHLQALLCQRSCMQTISGSKTVYVPHSTLMGLEARNTFFKHDARPAHTPQSWVWTSCLSHRVTHTHIHRHTYS